MAEKPRTGRACWGDEIPSRVNHPPSDFLTFSRALFVSGSPGLLGLIAQHRLAGKLNLIAFLADAFDHEKVRVGVGFRADLIVEKKVVVEIKSIEAISPVHKKQLLTYLRLTDKRLELLINFNVDLIKNGISRVVNQLPE